MLKQRRPVCKYLKAPKDHFTSPKLTLLYTDLRDIFYKTLDWDLNSHVPLLTVVHFVLQYLPTVYILSPSPFSPCYFFLSPLHLFLFLLSRCSQEREVQARRQMLEEERRRREEAERRLQDETAHRQRLVEEEVKMREKHFSQVSGAAGGDGRREEERGGGGGGDGRLGGEDERRDTKERLGIWEDQRLQGKGEKGETMESRVESLRGRTEKNGGEGCTKNTMYT